MWMRKYFYPLRRKQLTIFIFLCVSQTVWAIPGSEHVRLLGTNDLHSYLRPIYYRYLNDIKPWASQSREGKYKSGILRLARRAFFQPLFEGGLAFPGGSTSQQILNANVLINVLPMNTMSLTD